MLHDTTLSFDGHDILPWPKAFCQFSNRLICLAEDNFNYSIYESLNGLDWRVYGDFPSYGGQYSHHGTLTYKLDKFWYFLVRHTVFGVSLYRTLDGLHWYLHNVIRANTYEVPCFFFKVRNGYTIGTHCLDEKTLNIWNSPNGSSDWELVRIYDLTLYPAALTSAVHGNGEVYYYTVNHFSFKGKMYWYVCWYDTEENMYIDVWTSNNGVDWSYKGVAFSDRAVIAKYGAYWSAGYNIFSVKDKIVMNYAIYDVIDYLPFIQCYAYSNDGINFTHEEVGTLSHAAGFEETDFMGHSLGCQVGFPYKGYLLNWYFFFDIARKVKYFISWTKDGKT